MLEQISSWITNNKHKDDPVMEIKIKTYSDTCESETNPLVGPGGLGVVPLNPPGPVSLVLWHTNPEYRAGNFMTRKGILREKIVELNERFQNELKGRTWNRVRSIQQLQEQESSAISPPQNTPELNKALCFVLNIQICEVDEIHKKMFFYPEDLRSWSVEYPIYCVSWGSRSIYVKQPQEEARPFFKNWFFDLEEKKYKISYPTTEGTVKELKEKLNNFNLTLQLEAGVKPKKEDYMIILGKAESIRHINNEFI
jgi:hypothetical protein